MRSNLAMTSSGSSLQIIVSPLNKHRSCHGSQDLHAGISPQTLSEGRTTNGGFEIVNYGIKTLSKKGCEFF